MKVSFLDSHALASKLPGLVAKCTRLDIAMAYVKIGGLRVLFRRVDRLVRRRIPVRILFGLSTRQGIPDKESAEYLWKLSKRRNIKVKRYNSSRFHPKLLVFHGKKPSVVVGSSNLTEAAFSRNAEANLLVEDPDSQLFEDVTNFFEQHFNQAPALRKKDVDRYQPRKPAGRRGYRGPKEDELPSPQTRKHRLDALSPRKVWKIAPGEDGDCWHEWLSSIDEDGQGFVAMGWDVGDLNRFVSHSSLRNKVKDKAESEWDPFSDKKTKVGYATNQLWTFKNKISAGHVLIVYSECRVFGIALVDDESKYHYRAEDSISFAHQMNVKYLWYESWPRRADNRIVRTLGKQGTLRPVEEDWLWDHLLRKLP